MSASNSMPPDEYARCPNKPEQACATPLAARQASLGEGMPVRRYLPHRQKRMIGAWCFFDHAGPMDVRHSAGMQVGPHPHTCLQTFSWMMDGEILHRDSLGSKQLLRQGEVNLMTAGRGISHSEETPVEHSACLQLAQFWIALPEEKRFMPPAFEHYPDLPRLEKDGATITLLVGELLGEISPVVVHTPLLGADIATQGSTTITLPLQADFEYGIVALTGSATVDEHELTPGTLLYLGEGRRSLTINCTSASQIILLGGEPFNEDVVLFWNFVGRNTEEVREFLRQWHDTDHFGTVVGYEGPPLPAPKLPSNVRIK